MKRALAVCLLFAVAEAHAADLDFGRLFLTPAQRAALEQARRKNIRAEELAEAKAAAPKRPPVRSVVVTGVVKRSDGESTVWVNGKPVEGTSESGLKVRVTSGRAAVVIYDPEKGRTLRLKVGQSADITTGRVREPYEPQPAAPTPPPTPAEQPAATGDAAPAPSAESAATLPRPPSEDDSSAPPREEPEDGRG